jgi:hypothetical protein
LATAVSLGHGLPGMTPTEPTNVVLASAEDGLSDTVRPMLDAMGADVTRIYAIDGPLTLDAAGLVTLEMFVTQYQPALLVVDPIVAYLSGRLDMHKANQVREVLASIADLASRYGCAAVITVHLTKGARDRALYRMQGSVDFAAAARTVLLAGCDPDDPSRRALVQIKSNIGPFGDAIGYTIEGGRFAWTGATDLTADRILAAQRDAGGEQRTERDDAVAFLREALADGPRPADEITREAERLGISAKGALRRAREELGIKPVPVRLSGRRGVQRWEWALPADLGEHAGLDEQAFPLRAGAHLNADPDQPALIEAIDGCARCGRPVFDRGLCTSCIADDKVRERLAS